MEHTKVDLLVRIVIHLAKLVLTLQQHVYPAIPRHTYTIKLVEAHALVEPT
jgi:hypothetical protein